MPKGFKTCKNCAAVISAAAKVCKECGVAQLDAQYAERKKQPRSQKGTGHAVVHSDSEASEAELNAMMSDSETEREERVDAEDSGAAYAIQPADANDYLLIPQATNKAVTQPGERLDCPPFEWQHYLKDKRPMLELKAGTNVWYQATIIGESKTEIKVDFPATNKTPHVQEWITKCSSRIWRGPMGGNAWKYIKGSDGAWEPKVASGANTAGSRQRGSWQKGRQRRSGGQGRSRDATPTATGTGTATGDTARARVLAEAAMDTAASPQQPRPARPPPGAVRLGGGAGGRGSVVEAVAAMSDDISGWEDSEPNAQASPPIERRAPHHVLEQHQQHNSRPHHHHHHEQQPPQQAQQHWEFQEPRAAPSHPQHAQLAAVAQKIEDEGAAVGPPPQQPAASPGLDPLAAWFESHFMKLDSLGQLGEGVEGRNPEAGGGCWPLPQRLLPHDGEVVRSGGKVQREQQPGVGSKRKERNSPSEEQQPGKISRELKRLQAWEWDQREGGNASGSESLDDEMASDDDSMSGSRSHVPAERPQHSSSPGPWRRPEPRSSPAKQQQQQEEEQRRGSPVPRQEPPRPSPSKQQGNSKEERRPGHIAHPGAREVAVRVVEQLQPPKMHPAKPAAAAAAPMALQQQQQQQHNHHTAANRPHEPGRDVRRGSGLGERAPPPPGSQARAVDKAGTGAPAAGTKLVHKAAKQDGASRPAADAGKSRQERDFFSRPAAGPAPGRQQQGVQQQGVVVALGAASHATERDTRQQPQQQVRPPNQGLHSQPQVAAQQQQHAQKRPLVARHDSEQPFQGSAMAGGPQPPPQPSGGALKRKELGSSQAYAVEIVANASRGGHVHAHFPLPAKKDAGSWGGHRGEGGGGSYCGGQLGRQQQGGYMSQPPPAPKQQHYGNPLLPKKQHGWVQH